MLSQEKTGAIQHAIPYQREIRADTPPPDRSLHSRVPRASGVPQAADNEENHTPNSRRESARRIGGNVERVSNRSMTGTDHDCFQFVRVPDGSVTNDIEWPGQV